jgi:hypothetical protein
MVAVDGGLSHRLWRLVTSSGAYAVKHLDTTIDHARDPAMIGAAFEVERRALAAGLRLPRPVLPVGADGCLAPVESPGGTALVRVHEWAEGRAIPDRAVPPDLAGAARRAGRSEARASAAGGRVSARSRPCRRRRRRPEPPRWCRSASHSRGWRCRC